VLAILFSIHISQYFFKIALWFLSFHFGDVFNILLFILQSLIFVNPWLDRCTSWC